MSLTHPPAKPAPRQRLHRAGVAYVEHELLTRGCDLLRLDDASALTFQAWSRVGHPRSKPPLTIAVRAATVRAHRHRVKVKGKEYTYTYRHLHWNLHARGERRCQPDIWVLVIVGQPSTAFVVPGAALARTKTVQLQADPLPGRGGAAVRAYEGRWDLIAGRQHGRAGGGEAA